MDTKTLENKLIAELHKIEKDINDEQYDGMSIFYYYTNQDMPQRISSLKWAASKLLADILHPQWINQFLRDLDNINY